MNTQKNKTDIKKTRVWQRLITAILLFGFIALVIFFGTNRIRERLKPIPPVPTQPLAIQALQVKSSHFILTRCYTGTIVSTNRALISSQVSAKVKAIHYREGETVPMGALLITLDDRELRSEVGKLEATRKRIQADLDYWKRQADRDEKLLIVNAISAQKRDESKRMVASLEASFQVNEYALASANIKLEYTRIHAPFYGAIQRLDTEVGEVATQGKVLMEFVATRSLKAVFSVPQKDIAELTPHADKHSLETEQDNGSIPNEQATIVKLTVPYLNKTIHSHIAHVYPALDAGTRNATFDVPLPENVEGLRHGMTTDALVTLSKFEQALVVPRSSIRMHEGKPGVYTIEKNTAHWKPVTMGETQDTHVRVVSGIKVGETVIVTPDPRLQDGCRVQINKPWHSDL